MKRAGIVSAFLLVSSLISLSQTKRPAAQPKPASATAVESLPPFSSMVIAFCIGADAACSQPGVDMPFKITGLTAVGSTGQMALEGGPPRDARATLTRLDSGIIEISVKEVGGPGAGMTEKYTGTYKGGRVTGNAAFVWPGHAEDGKTLTWTARLQDVRAKTPHELLGGGFPAKPLQTMIMCENPQCSVKGHWTFVNSHGAAVWNINPAVTATLEVTKWTPEGIAIKRSDITQPGSTAEYVGTMQPGKPGSFSGITSYDRNGQKSMGTWFGNFVSTTCKRADGLIPDEYQAETLAANAINFGRMSDAMECQKIAANGGMPISTLMLAMIYAKGMYGVPADPKQAFHWASKAADSGDYKGELLLSEFYKDGIGTPQDQGKATLWRSKADASPEGKMERYKNVEDFNNAALRMFGSAFIITQFEYDACLHQLSKPYATYIEHSDMQRCIHDRDAEVEQALPAGFK